MKKKPFIYQYHVLYSKKHQSWMVYLIARRGGKPLSVYCFTSTYHELVKDVKHTARRITPVKIFLHRKVDCKTFQVITY